MATPLLFLDTNVCIDVANRNISEDDWNRATRYISRNFHYRISPHTLVELLIKIKRGDEAHFEKNQKPLRILAGLGGKPTFLPFPGAFAAQVLYGQRIPHPDFEPKDLLKWLVVTSRARERSDLQDGVELPGTTTTLHGMDLTKVEGDLQRGKDHHIERLERVRAGQRPIPTREQWGYMLDVVGRKSQNDAESLRVTAAFDAAYVLDAELFRLARSNGYDFTQHDSDYLDINQLFYLSDPRVHMVTMERRLPGRIAASTQRDRVLRFSELLERATAAARR